MNVTDNSAPMGSVNESASELTNIDNPDNWNFADPEEDNSEVTQEEGNEGEQVEEVEASNTESDDNKEETTEEVDEGESEGEESEETEVAAKVEDDTLIELPGGETVPIMELKSGYMRQSDYSSKTLEVSNLRKGVAAQAQSIEGTITAFTDYLASQIPDEPDASLAASNPQQYMAQKAQHDAVITQVQKLMEMGRSAKNVGNELTAAQQQQVIQEEGMLLASKFPQVTSEKGKQSFFETAFKGGEALGYTREQMSKETNHRLIGMAYYAQKGIEAEQAQKTVKEKVAGKPPVTPPNKRVTKGNSRGNRQAMQKLNQSGSMQDALAIDFD